MLFRTATVVIQCRKLVPYPSTDNKVIEIGVILGQFGTKFFGHFLEDSLQLPKILGENSKKGLKFCPTRTVFGRTDKNP